MRLSLLFSIFIFMCQAEDLKTLIRHMEHWAHRLFPKLQFEDFIDRVENLGNKKEVQVSVIIVNVIYNLSSTRGLNCYLWVFLLESVLLDRKINSHYLKNNS